jgi:outer membrane biosynthesis protein TonB
VGVKVLKSSGSKILDGAAVNLIKKVFPIDNPAARPITLEKAIRYSLVD